MDLQIYGPSDSLDMDVCNSCDAIMMFCLKYKNHLTDRYIHSAAKYDKYVVCTMYIVHQQRVWTVSKEGKIYGLGFI